MNQRHSQASDMTVARRAPAGSEERRRRRGISVGEELEILGRRDPRVGQDHDAQGIMVIPLIGTLDSARAKQVLEVALSSAQAHAAKLLDAVTAPGELEASLR